MPFRRIFVDVLSFTKLGRRREEIVYTHYPVYINEESKMYTQIVHEGSKNYTRCTCREETVRLSYMRGR